MSTAKQGKKNTVTSLRDALLDDIHQLRGGALLPKVAKEMNNAAGKVINTVKLQLEYARDRKVKPSIPFLNT